MPTSPLSTLLSNLSKTTPDSASLKFNEIYAGISSYVVSPIINLGLAGFEFSIKKDITVNLSAKITDHYVDNNTTIQQNIALEPITIILSGYVGEKEFKTKEKSVIQQVTEVVSTVNSFLPLVSKGVQQAKNIFDSAKKNKGSFLDLAKGNINSAVDIYSVFKTANIPQTNQSKAYNFFYSLYQAKQLVSLETPYRFFSQMAIQSIVAIQGEDTESISDFAITLKEVRTAQVSTTKIKPRTFKSLTKSYAQASNIIKNGVTAGKRKAGSILFNAFSSLKR